MKGKITIGRCNVTGYEMQSVKCANCRFNRVETPHLFLAAQQTENKTAGTICIATDEDARKRRRKAR